MISDEKLLAQGTNVGNDLTSIDVGDFFSPSVLSFSDTYPFGSSMRSFNPTATRIGYQGQEKENDVVGEGLAFKYRIHDARIGRFLSVDPISIEYPWNSPYSFAENKLGLGVELEGAELLLHSSKQKQKNENPKSALNVPYSGGPLIGPGVGLYSLGKNILEGTMNFIAGTLQILDDLNNQRRHHENHTPEENTAWDNRALNNVQSVGTDIIIGYATGRVFGALGTGGFSKLKNPARAVGFGEDVLLNELGGLQTRSYSKFSNVVKGKVDDAATKYLWTIDERGVNVALEQTAAATERGIITHTNISSKAYAGGEVWFTGENSVTVNAWSGRFGAGAGMTEAEWASSINAFKDLGYDVTVVPYTP